MSNAERFLFCFDIMIKMSDFKYKVKEKDEIFFVEHNECLSEDIKAISDLSIKETENL